MQSENRIIRFSAGFGEWFASFFGSEASRVTLDSVWCAKAKTALIPQIKPTGLFVSVWHNRFSRCVSTAHWRRKYWRRKYSRYTLSAAKLLNMQKPNYQFEKRRKELEKKAKKEEKRQQKLAASRPTVGNGAASAVPAKPV
jgi:hypothetical protein